MALNGLKRKLVEEENDVDFYYSQLTYADLAVACLLDSLCLNIPNADMTKCMQKYKELCCHHSMVCGLPAIKEHCAKRPSTPL